MNRLRYSIYTIVFAFFSALSCEEKLPPGPEDENQQSLPTFSRSSTWQLDSISLYEPFFHLSAIWGSSPSNIYAAGSGLIHYNGSAWRLLPMHSSLGGPVDGSSFGLQDIYGFSASDIWAVGRSLYNSVWVPLLLHFNGSAWSVVPNPGNFDDSPTSVFGTSPNHLWIGGRFGNILHYNGESWTKEALSFRPTSGDYWHVSDFAGYKYPTPYALVFLANSHLPYEARYLIKRNGSTWEFVDSLSTTAFRCNRLYMSPSGTLYGAGRHLCRWNGSTWEIIRVGTDSRSIIQVVGNSDNNLFALGGSVFAHSGFVDHYNGTDWSTVAGLSTQLPALTDAYTNGSRVAALGWDYTLRNYVLQSR